MTYFNTAGLDGDDLQERIEQCESQEDKVEALFAACPGKRFTPFEVRDIVFNGSVPITSVRRAMTNLTNEGILKKTETQREGPYGQPNYTWQLSKQPTLF